MSRILSAACGRYLFVFFMGLCWSVFSRIKITVPTLLFVWVSPQVQNPLYQVPSPNNWLLLQMLLSLVGRLLNTTLMWLNYANDDIGEAQKERSQGVVMGKEKIEMHLDSKTMFNLS